MKSLNVLLLLLLVLPALVQAQTCPEMVGQMIVTDPPPEPHDYIGGVILFEENLKGASNNEEILRSVQKYTKAPGSNVPRIVSFDQEGGLVQRLNTNRGFTDVPSHKEITAEGSEDRAGYWGGVTGKQVDSVGGNMNFSTVVDLCVDGNPIIDKYGRCFSRSPEVVASYGERHALGNMYYDVIPTLKHFPGHGASDGDSHLGFADVPKTRDQLFREDVAPYRQILSGISAKDLEQQNEWNARRTQNGEPTLPAVSRYPAVMVGHLNFSKIPELGDLPASLNREVVTGWLREGLHHNGLIVTDDIGAMKAIRDKYSVEEAAILAIKAGNDLVIIKNDEAPGMPAAFKTTQDQAHLMQSICTKAQVDPLLQAEIKDSYQRILQNKRDYHIGGQIDPNIDELPQNSLLEAARQLRISSSSEAPTPMTPSSEIERLRREGSKTAD